MCPIVKVRTVNKSRFLAIPWDLVGKIQADCKVNAQKRLYWSQIIVLGLLISSYVISVHLFLRSRLQETSLICLTIFIFGYILFVLFNKSIASFSLGLTGIKVVMRQEPSQLSDPSEAEDREIKS